MVSKRLGAPEDPGWRPHAGLNVVLGTGGGMAEGGTIATQHNHSVL